MKMANKHVANSINRYSGTKNIPNHPFHRIALTFALQLKKRTAHIIRYTVTACIALGSLSCAAQARNDSAGAPTPRVVMADTLPAKVLPFQPNPKKSGMYSALLPGMGQIYNRQYWKAPVIYAGLAVAGYFFVDNLNNYRDYRKAYIGRTNNPYPTDKYVGIYSTDQLQQLQNDYNRFLDLTVLFTTLGYALQVIDAITSAHLKNFDISRDISMRVAPVANPQGLGLGLVMNFK